MPRHAKILLVTWDGAGNLPPQRALVRALVARGHAVHALAHDAVRDMLEADGATFLPLRGVRQHDSKVAIPPDEEMPFFAEHIFLKRLSVSNFWKQWSRSGPACCWASCVRRR